MQQRIAEWSLKAELSEARRVRELLTTALIEAGVEKVEPFQLACSELIVNLSRYPDPKPEEVVLSVSRDESFWWLELRDNGPSFNNFSQQINSPNDLEAAECGMGLKLLAQLFTDMRYIPACYRDDACNLMVLRQSIDDGVTKKPTVLVVDDDPSYRAVISAYLLNQYQVVESESVQSAFHKLLRYQPELVICDIHMPDQDGHALFDQIAHIPEVAGTAFIYISGCDEPDKISSALSRPIDDFLAKPVTRDQLIECIDRALQRRNYLNDQIKFEFEQKVTLGLQPSLPVEIEGYQLQLRTINPEAGGGDLVQLHQAMNNNVILMADLMGHGLSAKSYSYALAGYLRGLFSALCYQQFDLPGLFSVLSDSFNKDPILKETLATLIAVNITEQGSLQWVNAGQPCPIKITKDSIEAIPVEGALPGLGMDEYDSYTCTIESGQRVLIYSDGFLDAADIRPNWLENVITKSSTMPISAAADFILMEKLANSKIDDDLTFILIEKK